MGFNSGFKGLNFTAVHASASELCAKSSINLAGRTITLVNSQSSRILP